MGTIHSHFPHDEYRYVQKKVIEDIEKVRRQDNNIDYIILEAPTGAGKTSITGTDASYVGDAYYVTEQIIQQDQVIEEFDNFESIKGQNNYDGCGVVSKPYCEDAYGNNNECVRRFSNNHAGQVAYEDEGKKYCWSNICSKSNRCPYAKEQVDAMKADVACLNYSYFLHQQGDTLWDKRQLAVLDEAHNIGDNLRNFVSCSIDSDFVESLGIDFFDKSGIGEWYDWVDSNLVDALDATMDSLSNHENFKSLQNKKTEINRFLSSCDDYSNWVVEKERDEYGNLQSISLVPIDVAKYANTYIWDRAEQFILMSATILDVDVFLRQVGLSSKSDQVYHIKMDSLFPEENRKIISYDGPRVSYSKREKSMKNISKMIEKIAREHSDDKGLIHSVSFEYEDMIIENLPDDITERIITHGDDEKSREFYIHDFKRSDDNKILMSPSSYEGLDLPHDQSRWQVIPKVPYLSLGAEHIEEKMDIDPMWYQWKACIKLIQSFGRSVRAKDDYATTYILDGNFRRFFKQNEHMFPEYIKGDDEEDGSLEMRDIVALFEDGVKA